MKVRKLRVPAEGGEHHVSNRCARGAAVFDEGERFLELLRRVCERDGLTVFAFCLMSNHYQVALRTGPVPLSRSLGFVQARVGQDDHRRSLSNGPLRQGRSKAKAVGRRALRAGQLRLSDDAFKAACRSLDADLTAETGERRGASA